ncbi:MAG: hypothetical protein GF409_01835 [Candidatus Omnitrophica bacterium]|nr:hypothetical protein [Candidatus Omnitrophota bacterium]
MMWDGIDQRRFPRISYKCRIRFSRGGKEELIETFTENIGAGGICVVLEKEFKLFENVSMEIYLQEDKEPFRCGGTVVWVVKRHPTTGEEKPRYDMGIEFTDISEKDRLRISRMVEDILRAKT